MASRNRKSLWRVMRFLANHGGSKYLDIAAAVVTLTKRSGIERRLVQRSQAFLECVSPFKHFLEASLAALDLLKHRWGGTRQRSQLGIVLLQDRVGVLIDDTRPRGLEFCPTVRVQSRVWFTGPMDQ